MHLWLVPLVREEAGTTAVEYALLAGLIAAVIAATVGVFGQAVNGLFDRFNTGFAG